MDKFTAVADCMLFRRLDLIELELSEFHISAHKSDLLIKERDEIKSELRKRGYQT